MIKLWVQRVDSVVNHHGHPLDAKIFSEEAMPNILLYAYQKYGIPLELMISYDAYERLERAMKVIINIRVDDYVSTESAINSIKEFLSNTLQMNQPPFTAKDLDEEIKNWEEPLK